MSSFHLSLPDDFEACGVCAGVGTVMETSSYGVPLRKLCRKCHGQGSLRTRRYAPRPDDEPEPDIESEEPEYEPPDTLEGLTVEYKRTLDEARACQESVERGIMEGSHLTYDDRLQVWARVHGIMPESPEAEHAFGTLAQALRGTLDPALCHELRYLSIVCSRLGGLKRLISLKK